MEQLTHIKLRKSSAEVHLKPSRPKGASESSSRLTKCLICLNNESRYSCPKCQIWYCSSQCYKSDRHQDCSEQFFKGLVEEALRSDVITTNEKQKMIEILKRQKESIENEIPIESLIDQKLNISESDEINDTEQLMELINEEEAQMFEKLIKDNSLINLMKADMVPWWESSFVVIPDDAPKLIEIVGMGKNATKINPILFLQISELMCVYSFIFVRYLHDPEDLLEESVTELFEISSTFAPTEKSKNLTFENVDEMFWMTFDKIRILVDSDQLALDAFENAAKICGKTIKIRHAISHILSLFIKYQKIIKSKKIKLAQKKMEFYLSWLLECVVPSQDYILNLEKFRTRISREMNQFSKDLDKIKSEKIPPITASNQLGCPSKLLIAEI